MDEASKTYRTFMDVLDEIRIRGGSLSDALEAFIGEGWDAMGPDLLEEAHSRILELFLKSERPSE